MLGLGLSPAAVAVLGARFDPRSLFAAGAAGAYYEISPSTTFTDTARTTPAQLGQAVAAVTDLVPRPELVTNGGFDAGLTGWIDASDGGTAVAVVDGAAQIGNNTATERLRQTISTVVGRTYTLEFAASGDFSVSRYHIGNTAGGSEIKGTTAIAATNSTTFVATATTTWLQWFNSGPPVYIDNASVRLTPNHLTQATAASRPILRQDSGGYYYLEFDGVDDFLAASNVGAAATWTAIAALRQTAADGFANVWSNRTSSQTGLRLNVNDGSGGNVFGEVGNGTTTAASVAGGVTTDNITAGAKYDGANVTAYRNGAAGSPSPVVLSGGATSWSLGKAQEFAGNFFTGRIYALLSIHRALSDAETVLARRAIGARAGVVL